MPSNTTSRVAAGVAAGLAVSAGPAIADTDGESAQLAPLVVTPTRMAQTVDESLSSVSVIDREQIDRQQPRQVSDLLQGQAGSSLTTSGPFGKSTSLFMRGTNSDHTLLLVDGVPMNSATQGGAAWQYLPPAEIDRIEVVRGPRTSVYGADAVGGVVQVFTRQGEEGPPRFRAFGGAGSFNTHEFGLGVSGGTAASRYALSASHYETDGINVQDGEGDEDPDGFENTSFSGRFSHRLPGGAELFATGFRSEGTNEFDGTRLGEEDWTDHYFQALRGGVRGDLTERWFSELAVSQAKDEQDNVDSRGETWQYTERHEVSWRNELYWGAGHVWAFGGDWRDEKVDTADDYDETSRYNAGAYSQLELDLGRHDLGASLRYDDNEAYGDNVTGQVAWGFDATDRLRLRSSYGTAFKAPTFNDLYAPENPNWLLAGGNTDLEAETSASAEVGARWQVRRGYVDAALFRTDIDNLIADKPVDGQQDWTQPGNVEEARIRGAELEAGAHWQEWQFSGAFTYLDHEDRETGEELLRRPSESFRLEIDRELGDFSLGATGLLRGRSYDTDFDMATSQSERVRLSGYGLLNLRTSYAITPEWTLRGTLENALDKEYETVGGYNQPGRAVYVSLHFNQQ
ncbi:TonB-dependent receptor domain-containing protein [Halorhodospira halophila]|uniref:TonB-dependent receptor n=1 Tax=Halorhodospira halophila (strain DSM 244 / SL1) TaxID=349124 RepID=A1WYC8_HALHL|nr:TonB-dependent receptor [Halorhodospira halophila]ABM62690.1 TonB-dependent receptor [Halorhodospira halophila SL1]MBK1728371.1 TonB-dependent receptor [Halorhodospira halophila]